MKRLKRLLPVLAAILVLVIIVPLGIYVGDKRGQHTQAVSLRTCTQENLLVDALNREAEGTIRILQTGRNALINQPNLPVPPGVSRQDILSQYDALIAAEKPLPHFDCESFK